MRFLATEPYLKAYRKLPHERRKQDMEIVKIRRFAQVTLPSEKRKRDVSTYRRRHYR
jgi:hypothetical protein